MRVTGQVALSRPAIVAFALVTQLGDLWLFVVVLAALYWFGDRDRGATLLAAMLGARALVVALKTTFARPRPSPPVALDGGTTLATLAISADGYGFPSGHAVGATVVWGLLALTLDVSTRRRRLAAAAVVVALVSLSRVVLHAHYPQDVLVGVGVGVAYLLAVYAAMVRHPERGTAFALGLGLVVGIVALATSGGGERAAGYAGGLVGIAAARLAVDVPGRRWPRSGTAVGLALGTLSVVGALGVAVELVAPPPVAFVAAAVAFGVVVALPALASPVLD